MKSPIKKDDVFFFSKQTRHFVIFCWAEQFLAEKSKKYHVRVQPFKVWVSTSLLAELFYTEGHVDRCPCPVPCLKMSFYANPAATFAYTSHYDLQHIFKVNNNLLFF